MTIPGGMLRTRADSNDNTLASHAIDVFAAARSAARRGAEATCRAVLEAELAAIELIAITARRPPNRARLLELLAAPGVPGRMPAEVYAGRKRHRRRAAA